MLRITVSFCTPIQYAGSASALLYPLVKYFEYMKTIVVGVYLGLKRAPNPSCYPYKLPLKNPSSSIFKDIGVFYYQLSIFDRIGNVWIDAR